MLQFKPVDRNESSSVDRASALRLFCGEILRKWPHFPCSDVEKAHGEPARLIALLRNTYGYSQRRAEKELDLLTKEFSEKLRQAA